MAKERKFSNGSKRREKGFTHASVSAKMSPEELIAVLMVFVASETVEISNIARALLDTAGTTVDAGPTKAEAMLVIIRQTTRVLDKVFIFVVIERLNKFDVCTSCYDVVGRLLLALLYSTDILRKIVRLEAD
jgi:hypothetical protein